MTAVALVLFVMLGDFLSLVTEVSRLQSRKWLSLVLVLSLTI